MAGTNRFDALDLLRGVAAISVLLLHVPRPQEMPALLPHAYLAVDLFFALSGFVIAYAYWHRLREGEGVGRFLIERLIRLYPLYLLATLVGGLLILDEMLAPGMPARSLGEWGTTMATNLLFLPALPGNAGEASRLFPAVFPAWSLFWELVANLAFALLAPRLGGRMLAAILALGLGLLVATGAAYGTLDGGVIWANGWAGGGRVIWSFFAGVALYRLHCRYRPRIALPGWLLTATLLGVFAVPLVGWGYDVALAAIGFPLLVFAAVRSDSRSRIGYWLGYISYAVYVLHAPILTLVDKLARSLAERPAEALPPWIIVPVSLGLTLAAAAVAVRRYDDPVRAWLKRFLHARPRHVLTA